MKKIVQFFEIVLIASAFIFIVVYFSVNTISPINYFPKDIFGFPVEEGFLFFLSWHGIIVVIMFLSLFYVIKLFINFNNKIK